MPPARALLAPQATDALLARGRYWAVTAAHRGALILLPRMPLMLPICFKALFRSSPLSKLLPKHHFLLTILTACD